MVGGGGISTSVPYAGAMMGAGGAAFVGGVILPAGAYSITVGKYTSCNPNTSEVVRTNTTLTHYATGNLISAESAGSLEADIIINYPWYKGKLKISSNLQIRQGTVILESDGNPPNYDAGTGGASLYNGYGRGADRNANNQTNGYFKLEFA